MPPQLRQALRYLYGKRPFAEVSIGAPLPESRLFNQNPDFRERLRYVRVGAPRTSRVAYVARQSRTISSVRSSVSRRSVLARVLARQNTVERPIGYVRRNPTASVPPQLRQALRYLYGLGLYHELTFRRTFEFHFTFGPDISALDGN